MKSTWIESSQFFVYVVFLGAMFVFVFNPYPDSTLDSKSPASFAHWNCVFIWKFGNFFRIPRIAYRTAAKNNAFTRSGKFKTTTLFCCEIIYLRSEWHQGIYTFLENQVYLWNYSAKSLCTLRYFVKPSIATSK